MIQQCVKVFLITLINPSTYRFRRPRFLKQMTNYSDYLKLHDEGIVLGNFPIVKCFVKRLEIWKTGNYADWGNNRIGFFQHLHPKQTISR